MIAFELRGNVFKGGFTFVKTKGHGKKNWLLIKKKDEYSQAKWMQEQALAEEKKHWGIYTLSHRR